VTGVTGVTAVTAVTQNTHHDPPALLAALRARGFALAAAGGKVTVSPGSRLTPDDRAALTRHKGALLALLEGEADPFADLPPPRLLWGREEQVFEVGRWRFWTPLPATPAGCAPPGGSGGPSSGRAKSRSVGGGCSTTTPEWGFPGASAASSEGE
jgi:hypothetical protein